MRLLAVAGLLLLPLPLPAQDVTGARHAILETEDRRPTTREGLAPILTALSSTDTVAQRLAVRALGRQERADLIADIAPLLRAATASVRMEAANALGQAASHDGAVEARRHLEDRLGIETDPAVRGVIFRTLGRIPSGTDQAAATERLLIQGSRGPGADAPPETLEGVAHGLASLYRRTAARVPPSVPAVERLVELIQPSQPPLVRRLAMIAFAASGRTDSGALLDAQRDGDWQVRRLVAVAAGAQAELPGRERILKRALADSVPQVRLEALRAWGRRLLARDGCLPVVQAVEDPAPSVQLVAIDLLAQCGAGVANILTAIAREPATETEWHRPAHALVSLAKVAPELAREQFRSLLSPLPSLFFRSWLADAAGIAADTALLVRLARDPHPNVRTAAITGLQRVMGHGADSLYLAALESRDHQLLLTAAQALDSTPDAARAVPALRRALARTVKEGQETSIDARRALGTTLAHLGAPTADTLLRSPLSTLHSPSWSDLERMGRTRATFVMADGGRFTLRLFPFDAPTNVARFVRMARSGWFDGLTFHRVVPNFVIQGGSPGANEYAGDGPFTRDELSLRSNLRGTVGLSTRGRDTGDGQPYVNLVDNIRLDHDYTVWGEVTDGMDVIDRMLEGAVIARVILEEMP